jgi:hypothetical protein
MPGLFKTGFITAGVKSDSGNKSSCRLLSYFYLFQWKQPFKPVHCLYKQHELTYAPSRLDNFYIILCNRYIAFSVYVSVNVSFKICYICPSFLLYKSPNYQSTAVLRGTLKPVL